MASSPAPPPPPPPPRRSSASPAAGSIWPAPSEHDRAERVYADWDDTADAAPRPVLWSALILVSAILAVASAYVPWITDPTMTGMAEFTFDDGTTVAQVPAPGSLTVMGGILIAGIGIALFAAGRVMALAIIGIVLSGLGVLAGLGLVVIIAQNQDAIAGSQMGIGALAQPVIPMIALAGSIGALVRGRR